MNSQIHRSHNKELTVSASNSVRQNKTRTLVLYHTQKRREEKDNTTPVRYKAGKANIAQNFLLLEEG